MDKIKNAVKVLIGLALFLALLYASLWMNVELIKYACGLQDIPEKPDTK